VIAAGLLARLAVLGVSAQADHGALRLRPASVISPDLMVMLREHKAELLAVLNAPANDLETLPLGATVGLDSGALPAGSCPGCAGGSWWRLSVLSGGPGPWRCRCCEPSHPDAWLDGHTVPALGRRDARRT
jgi:hypothetical protein